MKLFFVTFIILFSESVLADEIPEIVKQDPKTLEWNWSYFAKDTQATGYMADFTKQGKIGNGPVFLPWAGWDIKNSKWTTAMNWFRIDCENNTIDSPGAYEKGLFSSPNLTVYKDGQIGDVPRHMICGLITTDGDKIFGLSAAVTETSITYYGWIPDKIKKENIKNSLILFDLYQYDIPSRKKGFRFISFSK